MHAHTHPPNHSLTHTLKHSFKHTITHSNTHSLIHPLTHPPTHSLTHSLTHHLVQSHQVVPYIVKNSLHFKEPEGSVPSSQKPATCLISNYSYINPADDPPTHFLNISISYHLRLGTGSGLFLSGLPTNTSTPPRLEQKTARH